MIPFICIEILILKEKFEDTKVVNERMTDNTMTKIIWTKGHTKIYKTIHKTPKIEHHEPTNSRRCTQVLWKGKQFLLHMWYPSCYSCYNPSDNSWMWKEPDCYYNKVGLIIRFIRLIIKRKFKPCWSRIITCAASKLVMKCTLCHLNVLFLTGFLTEWYYTRRRYLVQKPQIFFMSKTKY
jgi:hypothetical protein